MAHKKVDTFSFVCVNITCKTLHHRY